MYHKKKQNNCLTFQIVYKGSETHSALILHQQVERLAGCREDVHRGDAGRT